MDWLDQTITSLAQRVGVDPSTLTVAPADRRDLLDVARAAAHTSGERTNAPLLCYVLGLLAGRDGVSLGEAVRIVKEEAGE